VNYSFKCPQPSKTKAKCKKVTVLRNHNSIGDKMEKKKPWEKPDSSQVSIHLSIKSSEVR